MFKRFIPFVSALVCIAGTTHAQLQPCSTDEHYDALVKKYPQLVEMRKQFDHQLSMMKTTAAVDDTTVYDIPMVVHVIHDYGTENVTDDAVYDAVAYWSTVYQKQNADTASVITPFIPWIGNPKMRLHLASKDPNGHPTKGVVRVNSYLTNSGSDEAKYDAWPNNKYINVWLIGTFGAGATGAAAYAYYPSVGQYMPDYDGVISLASYVNYDKTIPHELGHVLNLQHVWGNTNAPDVACGDDQVDDTPPTKGHNPVGCTAGALYDVTCAVGYSKTYISSSGLPDSVVNYPDTVNSQNIMDYTYCERMFTKGQVVRMRTALNSSVAGRNNLITAGNLVATGALDPRPDLAPIADFTENKATGNGAVPDLRSVYLTLNNAASFVFRNASWNDTVSSVRWEFSNGATTPVSTSMTTIANKFTQTGWVSVKLVANSNAGSDSVIRNAVYVADTATAGTLGFEQNFGSEPANWPMFNYYNNRFQWQYYAGSGVDDNGCLRYRSFDTSNRRTGIADGDFDDVYTPSFNITNVTANAYVNFYVNGARTSPSGGGGGSATADSLEIDVSINGGVKWTKIGGLGNGALATAGNKSTEYTTADPTKWVQKGILIPAAYRTAATFFRIRLRPGSTGNNVFVDKVALSTAPAGVAEVITAANPFSVYPNPAANGCNLVFKTGAEGNVAYAISDLAGKVVFSDARTFASGTMQEISIPRSATPAAGMYFITLTIDGKNTTQKLVVY
jgi:hypothetical protein